MKYLGEGLKYLPNNLQNFTLELTYNNLGNNSYNLKYIAEGMK